MANNYENLQTELETLANKLTNNVAKYKCLILIGQYVDALESQATAAATDVSSYSIAGRSVVRSSTGNIANTAARLEGEINALLYGITTHADFRESGIVTTDEL
jgi:hypothetical protein